MSSKEKNISDKYADKDKAANADTAHADAAHADTAKTDAAHANPATDELKENIRKFIEVRNESGMDFASANGMKITKVDEGYVRVDMDVTKEHLNPINSIHGGVIFTIADSASGTAVFSMGGTRSTSIDANIHYLRPGINKTHIYAEARVIKMGRNVAVAEVSVKDQDDTELAIGTFTNMILDESKADTTGWTKFKTK